jgi:hypothetical protein
MNIFALDKNPAKAAEYHCNQHVNKMISETAMMMSVAHWELDGRQINGRWWHPDPDVFGSLNLPGYNNHPCTKWVRRTRGNYEWAFLLFYFLAIEFEAWRGKEHGSYKLRRFALADPPKNIDQSLEMTPWVQCMPQHCKVPNDPVAAYRKFYIREKSEFATWTDRKAPDWYEEKNYVVS